MFSYHQVSLWFFESNYQGGGQSYPGSPRKLVIKRLFLNQIEKSTHRRESHLIGSFFTVNHAALVNGVWSIRTLPYIWNEQPIKDYSTLRPLWVRPSVHYEVYDRLKNTCLYYFKKQLLNWINCYDLQFCSVCMFIVCTAYNLVVMNCWIVMVCWVAIELFLSNPSLLAAICKYMWAVKLCSNKTLQFLTVDDG